MNIWILNLHREALLDVADAILNAIMAVFTVLICVYSMEIPFWHYDANSILKIIIFLLEDIGQLPCRYASIRHRFSLMKRTRFLG
mmetsp:Transcript_3165/g.7372  ORF Transcript_3165/g.7372 Transcript_3165/m.7372 type:complete len:85 (+) Transcript_3165:133-387(+)